MYKRILLSCVFLRSYLLSLVSCPLFLLFLPCLLSLVPGALYSDDWPSFWGNSDPAESSRSSLESSFSKSAQPFVLKGSPLSLGDTVLASPVMADGLIVLAQQSGNLLVLRESDRALVWSFQTGGQILGTPVVHQGVVYVLSNNGFLRALALESNPQNPTPLWQIQVGAGNHAGALNFYQGVLYLTLGFPQRDVIAVEAKTGTLLWKNALGQPSGVQLDQITYSSPVLDQDQVYVGANNGILYALRQSDGSRVWTFATTGQVLTHAPLVDDTSLYFVPGGHDPLFYRVDKSQALWPLYNWTVSLSDPNRPASGVSDTWLSNSFPIKVGRDIVFAGRFEYTGNFPGGDQLIMNEYLFWVDPVTHTVRLQGMVGSLKSQTPNDHLPFSMIPTPAAYAVSDGSWVVVAASSTTSKLCLFDSISGYSLWTANLQDRVVASVALANSRLYVATLTGTLDVFQSTANEAPDPVHGGFTSTQKMVVPPPEPGQLTFDVTLSWIPPGDRDGDALTYLVRIDQDNEVLMNWEWETTSEQTQTEIRVHLIPRISRQRTFLCRIRARDVHGAWSGWSPPQFFTVSVGHASMPRRLPPDLEDSPSMPFPHETRQETRTPEDKR